MILCGFMLFIGSSPLRAQIPPTHVDNFTGHPRVIVISDIGNEPDDQMSFVRLLLYSNELDLEALIASTSTWQKNVTHPETMHTLIHAYGDVRQNLLLHAKGWPSAEELDSRVFAGQPGYGMAATGAGKVSEGAEAIIRAADRDDARPLWVCIWGGANTLAEALMHVRKTRKPEDVKKFVEEFRVYSISDQDDAGPWIRREFPGLFYIVQPSTPTGGEYYYATWTGISGDEYYRNGAGADFSTVTNAWLDAHIRSKGPLGKLYPRYLFIMEGDTPSFLGLIDNGLEAFRRPDWGGWGGRYVSRQPYGETHPIWTQGGDMFSRVTSQDTMTGADGKRYTSDQATIWRWRDAFQNDFAARMAWTVEDYAHANHNPVVEVNGQPGTAPIMIDAEVGQPVVLDASQSRDPDRDKLHFNWFHFGEAGGTGTNLSAVTIQDGDTAKATVTSTAVCRANWLQAMPQCSGTGTAHIILAVTDDGSPPLTSYRRIILTVHPAAH
jgi:Cellulose-binding Sde182, nucleoside hydrolase-like domain/Cellulose-binding protein Sde0182, C-terminal domain